MTTFTKRRNLAALDTIVHSTTVPVPPVLKWIDADAVGCVTMEKVRSANFLEAWYDLDPEKQNMLEGNFSAFVDNVLLPQLQKLRSTRMGQLEGVMFPPIRVSHYDKRPRWEPKISSTDRYVYCHNDLGLYNVMVNPDSLAIEAVIDWEYSGFFPPKLEFPFWSDGMDASFDEEHCKKMIDLLDAPSDPPMADRLVAAFKSFTTFICSLLSWIKIKSSRILSAVSSNRAFK